MPPCGDRVSPLGVSGKVQTSPGRGRALLPYPPPKNRTREFPRIRLKPLLSRRIGTTHCCVAPQSTTS